MRRPPRPRGRPRLLLLLLPVATRAALTTVWTPNLGLTLVATCPDPALPCPAGTACDSARGVCLPNDDPARPTCYDCNYSGGTRVDCALACPAHTRLSAACGSPWLAPPNTKPCRAARNFTCVGPFNRSNTCADEPMRCVQRPCT
jgi:hypothetical protein